MEPWFAGVIILGAAVVGALGMLIVRRGAPQSFLKDPIPMAAVYTVVGTAYMVIVAFVFFVAFESYGGAKSDAEDEATATLAMFHTALPFDPSARAQLQGQVICISASGSGRASTRARSSRPSGLRCGTARRATSSTRGSGRWKRLHRASHSKATSNWRHTSTGLSLNEERRKGRQGRIGEASGLVPPVLWLILILGALAVVGGVAFFADARESRATQAAMMVAVVGIVVSGLLLVRFLDQPYADKSGGIKPTAMTRTLAQMQTEQQRPARVPC
jgi:hypothetical protein